MIRAVATFRFTLAEIQAAPVACITALVDAVPELSSEGWGHGGFSPVRLDLAKCRAEMVEPWFVAQFLRAAEWLDQVPHSSTMNRRTTSYGWKHAVERWHQARGAADHYVSNGMFLAACIAMGRRVEPLRGSLNPHVALPGRAQKLGRAARDAAAPATSSAAAPPNGMDLSDRSQLAWLMEWAGRGCCHEGHSARGAQLFRDAVKLRQEIERDRSAAERRRGGGR